MPPRALPHEQRAAHAAELKARKAVPATGLQADYEAALHKRRIEYGAAPATIEALMFELREYGDSQLDKENCQRRLSDCSAAQLREIITRLNRLRPKYPNITDDLLGKLKGLLP